MTRRKVAKAAFLPIAVLLSLGTLAAHVHARGENWSKLRLSVAAEKIQDRDGLTHYRYTVSNPKGNNCSYLEFSIQLCPKTTLQEVTAPDNWEIQYKPGFTDIAWEASDSETTFIRPGESVIFSFASEASPYCVPSFSDPYSALGRPTDSAKEFCNDFGHIYRPGGVADKSVSTPKQP
jgi:hypothetical protein